MIEQVLDGGEGPLRLLNRAAFQRAEIAVVVGLHAGIMLLGELRHHDQAAMLLGQRNPRLTIRLRIAQLAVHYEHDRRLGRKRLGPIDPHADRLLRVALRVDKLEVALAWWKIPAGRAAADKPETEHRGQA